MGGLSEKPVSLPTTVEKSDLSAEEESSGEDISENDEEVGSKVVARRGRTFRVDRKRYTEVSDEEESLDRSSDDERDSSDLDLLNQLRDLQKGIDDSDKGMFFCVYYDNER